MDAHFSQYILKIIPFLEQLVIPYSVLKNKKVFWWEIIMNFLTLIQNICRTTLNFILYFHQLMMTSHYVQKY